MDHPDKRVRLQLALTLGEWDHPDASDALVRLALANVDDNWMRTAVLSSSRRHADSMLANVLRSGHASRGRSQLVQGLISTALGSVNDDRLGRVLKSITAFEEQPQLWQIEALASFDRALRRRQMSLASLRDEATVDLQESLQQVAKIVDMARRLAVDEKAAVEQRLTALPLLGRGFSQRSEDLETLAGLLSPHQPVALQLTAAEDLSQFTEEHISELLLRNWRHLSPQVQSEILAALLSRRAWHERLVSALEAGLVQLNDLDATTRTRLTSTGNRQLRDRAQQLIAGSDEDRRDVVERFRTVNQLAGNPMRGRQKFASICAACHRHNEVGNEFGPKLAALQDKSNEALLVSILDPNRAIENKYKSYTCVTVDGRVLNGMIVSESASSITLAQANGTKQVLLRIDIDELSSTGVSFMPVGLEKDLEPQDLSDLFAFIRHDGRLKE